MGHGNGRDRSKCRTGAGTGAGTGAEAVERTEAGAEAGQGRAGQGRAGLGWAVQCSAGQGRVGQGRAGQNRTEQDRAGQAWAPTPGGRGGDASPSDQKSEGDVPSEIAIFTDIFLKSLPKILHYSRFSK